jgi:hypothetical protein
MMNYDRENFWSKNILKHEWSYAASVINHLYIMKELGNLLGHAVAQLVEVLRYKLNGRGFDSRWCLWNFWLT